MRNLVETEGVERKKTLEQILKESYPSFWDGSLDLRTATAGQFDEHVRGRFGAKGSTIDKIAWFFLAAAEDAGIEVSAHLKGRRPLSRSGNSQKTPRARKSPTKKGAIGAGDKSPNSESSEAKPLEYRLIDMLKEPNIEDEHRQAIWTLVQYLTENAHVSSDE